MRRSSLLLVCTVVVSAATARAATPPPAPSLYPTDRCVAAKLSAAASACGRLFEAQAFDSLGFPGRSLRDTERVLPAVQHDLGGAWAAAEAASQGAGVDCQQTTATADEVLAGIQDGVKGIRAQIHTAIPDGSFLQRSRTYTALHLAGLACSQLVEADSRHLLGRSADRERVRLDRDRRIAVGQLELLLRFGARLPNDAMKLTESVKGLATEIAQANLVSPNVSPDFTMIEPPAQVQYQDKTLEPICSRGTPWVHYVRRGTVNKLLVYYQGGGACWDYLTCETLKTFDQSVGPNDNPANATAGFANLANPENPFRDWNVVYVPYCTGDVHWGDATVAHTRGNQPPVTIQHKGFVNAQVAEKWAREHFVNPDEVFVTGSSAGAYGAILNGAYLQERVYPSSDFSTLGDAGNGIVPQAFLETEIAKWGIDKTLPKWIPALDKPVTELDASKLWAEAANFYPTHRFANYSTAYDGGQGGQVGFYKVMTTPENFLDWANWWTASCEWHAGMLDQVKGAFAGAPANYRYYIGSGARHTMWGSNKVYTDTTGDVPTLVAWVSAMRGNTPEWTNVETTDPGLLLSGDPRPNPVAPPYTAEGRIVCEEPPVE